MQRYPSLCRVALKNTIFVIFFAAQIHGFLLSVRRNPSVVAYPTYCVGQDTCRGFSNCRLKCLRMKTNTNDIATSADPDSDEDRVFVRNFRQARALPCIYRCGSTDDIVDAMHNSPTNADSETATAVLLHRARLVLDLRSPSERDEERAQQWMTQAPGGPLSVIDWNDNLHAKLIENERAVLRIDVLSPPRLFSHLESKWLNPSQRALSALFYTFDTNKLHELRMDVLNEKGLFGLYEAILFTSGNELCAALQAITICLENFKHRPESDGAIVVHCVEGKDRTGIVVMLCQSMMGLADEHIIDDYFQSDKRKKSGSSAATTALGDETRGKLDRRAFSGAPREVMISTLSLIRSEWGSISEYLDSIGFDTSWQERYTKSIHLTTPSTIRSNL